MTETGWVRLCPGLPLASWAQPLDDNGHDHQRRNTATGWLHVFGTALRAPPPARTSRLAPESLNFAGVWGARHFLRNAPPHGHAVHRQAARHTIWLSHASRRVTAVLSRATGACGAQPGAITKEVAGSRGVAHRSRTCALRHAREQRRDLAPVLVCSACSRARLARRAVTRGHDAAPARQRRGLHPES